MRSLLVALSLAALGLPAAATAQQEQPDTVLPAVGTRMRVTDPAGLRREGRYWYLRTDTLWLLAPQSRDARPVALTGAERVEYTRGRRRELWSGAGAVLGGVLGMVAAGVAHDDQPGDGDDAARVSEGVLGAAVGAITFGLTGWFVAPQRWHPVPLRTGMPAGTTAQAGTTP